MEFIYIIHLLPFTKNGTSKSYNLIIMEFIEAAHIYSNKGGYSKKHKRFYSTHIVLATTTREPNWLSHLWQWLFAKRTRTGFHRSAGGCFL